MGIGIALSSHEGQQPQSIAVDAGLELVVGVGDVVDLVGSVSYVGVEHPPAVQWSVLNGPSDVAFHDATAVSTTAVFSVGGQYVLELLATADALSVADTLLVDVISEGQPEPSPNGPDDSPHEPGADNPRLGLHVTQMELEIWRERAKNGPYRAAGDVSQNSPGDWKRIEKNAEDFLTDPSASRWDGPSGTGCITSDQALGFIEEADRPRDAAFVDLVNGTHKYQETVSAFLIEHASDPRLDLGDSSRWCPGQLKDSPFHIANWFTIMLFAYDYLEEDSLSPSEHALLRTWFLTAAEFMSAEVDRSLDMLYVNRSEGDYRLSAIASMSCGRVTHYDGWKTCSLHRHYNNRRAAMVRFFGLAGIKFDVDALQEASKTFFREFITYSVFPDGMIGEYERWRSDLPDLGWAYAAKALATLVTLADHFARIGDSSLYKFNTSAGALGTEGGVKSLRLAIDTLQALADGQLNYYGTDKADCLSSKCRIDGINTATNWFGLHDVMIAPANLYYQDDELRKGYMRDGVAGGQYPDKPAGVGPNPPWMGDWGVYPGILFTWGQIEGVSTFPN